MERAAFDLKELTELVRRKPASEASEATLAAMEQAFDSIRGSWSAPEVRQTSFLDLTQSTAWTPPADGEVLRSTAHFDVHRIRLIGAAEWQCDAGLHEPKVDHFMVAALVYAEVAATLVVFHKQMYGWTSWFARSPSKGLAIAAELAALIWLALKWFIVAAIAYVAWDDAPVLSILIGISAATLLATRFYQRMLTMRLSKAMMHVYHYATSPRIDWHAMRSALDAATALGARFDGVVHGLVARNLR